MTTVMPKYIHPTTQAVSKRDNMYTLVDYSKKYHKSCNHEWAYQNTSYYHMKHEEMYNYVVPIAYSKY